MRRPLIAANWKMNLGREDEALGLVRRLRPILTGVETVEVVLCPPFTVIAGLSEVLANSPIGLGAQTMHWNDAGAHTGDVSPSMLAGLWATWAINDGLRLAPSLVGTAGLWMLLLAYFPTWVDVRLGQWGLICLALASLVWRKTIQGDDRAAGAVLGVLCGIKIFAGFLVVYFVFCRRWRVVSWFMGTFTLTLLLPLAFWGSAPYLDYLRLLPDVTWWAASWNASMRGVLSRVFGGSEVVPWIDAPLLGRAIELFGSAVLVGSTYRIARRAKPGGGEMAFSLGFGFALVAMLLVSPLGWIYYFPVLLLPMAVVIQWSHTRAGLARTRRILLGAWILTSLPVPLIPAQSMDSDWFWSYLASIYCFGLLVFAVTLAWLGLRDAPAAVGVDQPAEAG